jgi:hypothetical protein
VCSTICAASEKEAHRHGPSCPRPLRTARDRFAPRALFRRSLISVQVTPFELFVLVEALESRAAFAAGNSETIGVAGHWFDRAAELREVGR